MGKHKKDFTFKNSKEIKNQKNLELLQENKTDFQPKEKNKTLFNKRFEKKDIFKKSKIELNSKLKKKIKSTKKLLKFDENKIENAINYIINHNKELSEKFNKEFFNNIYGYIILKNKITDEIDSFKAQEFKEKIKKYSKFKIEKVGDLNDDLSSNMNQYKIKNFFCNLPVDFIDEKNKLKILLINNDITTSTEKEKEKEKEKLKNKKDEKIKKKSSEDENYDLFEKLLSVKFKNKEEDEKQILKFEKNLEIKTLTEFIEMLKNTKHKSNLNFLYKSFICDEKIKSRLNDIFFSDKNKEEKKKKIFFNSFDDVVDVHFFSKNSKNTTTLENLISLIELAKKNYLCKNLDNKIFKVKLSNCSNTKEAIKKNLNYVLYNLTSFLLAKSNKYNNIKSIVIKSENSIPITIYGDLDIDEVEYFNI